MSASSLPDLEGAMLVLDAARVAKTKADAELARARDALQDLLRVMGAEMMIGGDRLPDPLVARLYWDYPEVSVSAIGAAIGVRANAVFMHAGRGQRRTCRLCGDPLDFVPSSRTSPGPRTSTCESCAEQMHEQYDINRERWQEQLQRQREQRVSELARGGYWIDEYGETVTGIEREAEYGCNMPDPDDLSQRCQERLSNATLAWQHGGEVSWTCLRCGRVTSDVLVVWVPPRSDGA